jgi:hypothetical protein
MTLSALEIAEQMTWLDQKILFSIMSRWIPELIIKTRRLPVGLIKLPINFDRTVKIGKYFRFNLDQYVGRFQLIYLEPQKIFAWHN